jgi:hypothetical protein
MPGPIVAVIAVIAVVAAVIAVIVVSSDQLWRLGKGLVSGTCLLDAGASMELCS